MEELCEGLSDRDSTLGNGLSFRPLRWFLRDTTTWNIAWIGGAVCANDCVRGGAEERNKVHQYDGRQSLERRQQSNYRLATARFMTDVFTDNKCRGALLAEAPIFTSVRYLLSGCAQDNIRVSLCVACPRNVYQAAIVPARVR